ncbi:hypothetical protein IFT67_12620 [Sphingomonas sp. CFBP 13728]|uniref:hypothetical protein n=1 Tax=Sphingomonas sp. CFBP 13728 TaxID=2775294 RepID=UPI0017837AC8|nr:hypothetical protein [Sphingomonas sp. CFBP 13728]MBD8619766.1 hypothetical protein [Sphingomonas sp. CFBP 13728]
MAKNATPWPKMIRAVYDSFESGRHQGDAIARRVMDRIVSWLAGGLELSPRLQAKLIDNINMRTSFSVVDPGCPVRLTRDQINYARKTNPEWFDLSLAGEEEPAETERKGADLYDAFPPQTDAITIPLRQFYDLITTPFHTLCDSFPTEALVLAQHLVAIAAGKCGSGTTDSVAETSKVMKREVNGTNHEGMTLASPSICHDLPDIRHEVHEDCAIPPMIEGEGHGEKTAARPPCVTVWVKPDATGTLQASGYLDRDGSKYAMKFSGFDNTLERIGQQDPAFYGYMASQIAPVVLPEERTGTGIAARATTSALFGTKDTKGFKPPVRHDTAMLLTWDGNVPTQAFLIEGETTRPIDLKQEGADRFKGVLI